MKNSEEQAERRVGRGREPAAEMRPEEVIRLVDRLKKSGVEVWLDGGWCVDALLGERRRPHDDLDLVVDLRDVPQLQETLSQERYELLGGAAPISFEMVDPEGRQVDVHPVAFDENGDERLQDALRRRLDLPGIWVCRQRRDSRPTGALPDARSADALSYRLRALIMKRSAPCRSDSALNCRLVIRHLHEQTQNPGSRRHPKTPRLAPQQHREGFSLSSYNTKGSAQAR
jgi:hypothetical protein